MALKGLGCWEHRLPVTSMDNHCQPTCKQRFTKTDFYVCKVKKFVVC